MLPKKGYKLKDYLVHLAQITSYTPAREDANLLWLPSLLGSIEPKKNKSVQQLDIPPKVVDAIQKKLDSRAEAQTGAGTATVTRELAERVNDGAAPADKVSGKALRQRVKRKAGEVKSTKRTNNQPIVGIPHNNQPELEELTPALSTFVTSGAKAISVGFLHIARNRW